MVSSVDGLAGAAAVGSSGAAAASRSCLRLGRGPDYSTTSITPHRQGDRIGFLLRALCPLLAQSGHPDTLNECPLLGVKRTLDSCLRSDLVYAIFRSC